MSAEDNEGLAGANAINLAAARGMTEETGTAAHGVGNMRAAVNARTSTPDTVRVLDPLREKAMLVPHSSLGP